jgi:hypothetical protein
MNPNTDPNSIDEFVVRAIRMNTDHALPVHLPMEIETRSGRSKLVVLVPQILSSFCRFVPQRLPGSGARLGRKEDRRRGACG